MYTLRNNGVKSAQKMWSLKNIYPPRHFFSEGVACGIAVTQKMCVKLLCQRIIKVLSLSSSPVMTKVWAMPSFCAQGELLYSSAWRTSNVCQLAISHWLIVEQSASHQSEYWKKYVRAKSILWFWWLTTFQNDKK